MTGRLSRLALALLLPLALASCVLAPGKFVSTLRLDADRSFTYSYTGEVIAVDIGGEMTKGLTKGLGADTEDGDATPAALPASFAQKDEDTAKKAAFEARNRAIADALGKEPGYRKVAYRGDGKFDIDYTITGTLDRSFIFPYNLDAEIVFPFVLVEPRTGGTVRVKAPGFANDSPAKNVPGAEQATPSKLDGVFTIDTNAEIVSQNSEDGAVAEGARKSIKWKATPLTREAPTAVLRMR